MKSFFIEPVPLPTDLILCEVLPKLPIKSIAHCKLVCKTWNKFLNSPNFAEHYSKNSSFTNLLISCSRFLYNPSDEIRFFFLEISNRDSSSILTPINRKVPQPCPLSRSYLMSISCCNGLICLTYVGKFSSPITTVYIWNPITGGFIKLPELDKSLNVHVFHHEFGYTRATNQYKVLRVNGNGKVEICTVGVDYSWRLLPASFSIADQKYYLKGTTCGGVYYWTSIRDREEWIYTFDFGEEKYGRISCPPGVETPYHLRTLKDRLCVVFLPLGSCASSEIFFWTLNEDGSWTMEQVIPESCLKSFWYDIDNTHLLARLRNGNILYQLANRNLVSFDTKRKEPTKLEVNKDKTNVLKFDRGMFNYSYDPVKTANWQLL